MTNHIEASQAVGRIAGLKEAKEICERRVTRPAGYGGRWVGHGESVTGMTGEECGKAIAKLLEAELFIVPIGVDRCDQISSLRSVMGVVDRLLGVSLELLQTSDRECTDKSDQIKQLCAQMKAAIDPNTAPL